VVGLIERDGDLAAKLRLVPTDVDLAGASDADLDVLFAVQRDLDNIAKIGHVIRSKLLAHKRPRLVPIRDQYVLMALLDGSIIETPLWKGRLPPLLHADRMPLFRHNACRTRHEPPSRRGGRDPPKLEHCQFLQMPSGGKCWTTHPRTSWDPAVRVLCACRAIPEVPVGAHDIAAVAHGRAPMDRCTSARVQCAGSPVGSRRPTTDRA
jgi:hypothetical protein